MGTAGVALSAVVAPSAAVAQGVARANDDAARPAARRGLLRTAVAALLTLALPCALVAARATEPCEARWISAGAPAGPEGGAGALAWWDPDGPGPRGRVLVAGGWFTRAGAFDAGRVAVFDPASEEWTPLGVGTDDSVSAIEVLPDNSLVIGGRFTQADGRPAHGAARWTGERWEALGLAPGSMVNSIAQLQDGSLALLIQPLPSATIAPAVLRWDNGVFTDITPSPGASVRSLLALRDGGLAAGGHFPIGFPYSVSGVAVRRNGEWTLPRGPEMLGTLIYSMAETPDGTLYVSDDGVIHRRREGGWDAISARPNRIGGLRVGPDGALLAAAWFYTPGTDPVEGIVRWDGQRWVMVHQLVGVGSSIEAPDGSLITTGRLSEPMQHSSGVYLVRWDGAGWTTLGRGATGPVFESALTDKGALVVGGWFSHLGGERVTNVAMRTPAGWRALGQGVPGFVLALAPLAGGRVVVGGEFAHASGVPGTANVALWDGAAWRSMGGGVNGRVSAALALPDGRVVVGGEFTRAGLKDVANLALYDPRTDDWSGFAITDGPVYALERSPAGRLIVGGGFTTIGGVPALALAEWDGTRWSALPGLRGEVFTLAHTSEGELLVGGNFRDVDWWNMWLRNIARWDGKRWHSFQTGATTPVADILPLPDGTFLIAGGDVISHPECRGLARWDGREWHPVLGGVGGFGWGARYANVYTMTPLPDGTIAVGGDFALAGETRSPYLAYLDPGKTPPDITLDPERARVCAVGEATFRVRATGATTYRWQQRGIDTGWLWQDVREGDNYDPAGVFRFRAAGVGTDTLTLDRAAPPPDAPPGWASLGWWATELRCVVGHECSEGASRGAWLQVCAADFTCDGVVTPDDLQAFATLFASGDPRADLTGDLELTFDDAHAFVEAYNRGCR